MKWVVDLQGAQGENAKRGIGRYSLSLVEAIVRSRTDDEIVVLLNGAFDDSVQSLSRSLRSIEPSPTIKVWEPIGDSSFLRAGGHSWRRQANERIRSAVIAALEPDVLLVTSLFEGLVDDVTCSIEAGCTYETVVVLYDLIPYIFPEVFLRDARVEAWYRNRIDNLRNADLFLAISESSRLDALRLLGLPQEKVRNISAAADACFSLGNADPAVARRHGIVGKFILYTGGIDHRKNVERLISAYALLPAALRIEHQLVVVCSVRPADRDRLQSFGESEGLLAGRLVLTGYVTESDLVQLYRTCELFVFPAWYEGFGLPALEAMACGAAVIGAATSSVPEVVGHEEALFDPHDASSIERKIRQVLQDREFRDVLKAHARRHARGFSWERTAADAIAGIDELLPRRPKPEGSAPRVLAAATAHGRPRLAYVSPVAPSRSGVAGYSADLLPYLSQHYEIEVISSEPFPSDPWIDANSIVHTPAWASENADRYDRVLYHFGNSDFHKEFFGLADRVPGVVVLHDFFLSGIVHYMDAIGFRRGAWRLEIYRAHGYHALLEEQSATTDSDLVWKYPVNLSVLQKARGVIVHSKRSLTLADRWIGSDFTRDWRVIPHLRVPAVAVARAAARRRLGVPASTFLVCSFGMLGPMKLNHRLVDAWRRTALSSQPDCRLVFVGENADEAYGERMREMISGMSGQVMISGWASASVFEDHLTAADVAVQLRGLSRGETSGAVLDCLNHGLPTIVNANGSMADIPDDCVCMLPDEFTDDQLVQALNRLYADADFRSRVGKRAQAMVRDVHAPRSCAALYHEAIEFAYASTRHLDVLLRDLGEIDPPPRSADEVVEAARVIEIDFPQNGRRQLLVDVSELVQRDVATGIQRVVRAVLKQLLNDATLSFKVEPVYANVGQGYRYARAFTTKLLGLKPLRVEDEPIRYSTGDLFLGLDLQQWIVASQRPFYRQLRRHGVCTGFVVYDLIPVLHPQCFPAGSDQVHEAWLQVVTEADFLLPISHSVAAEVSAWIATQKKEPAHCPAIEVFRLGADIHDSIWTTGIPGDGAYIIAAMRSRPTFLMVGTVEPRKGQADVFSAFERLWQQGHDVGLVIVGKPGWLVDSLVERWSTHAECGARFHWLSKVSDEFLEMLYGAATCLIAASIAEGYGLPLIEAARMSLPVMARDIPVFREVAGDGAYYFSGLSAASLAEDVQTWLRLQSAGKAPAPENIQSLTWSESAAELLAGLIKASESVLAPVMREGVRSPCPT